MNKNVKFFLFGILTWIPGYLLFLLFKSKGLTEYTFLYRSLPAALSPLDLVLYKTISMLLMAAVGGVLLALYFRSVSGNYLREGFRVGVIWLALNLLLDMMFLIPKSGINFESFFRSTYLPAFGIGYLMLPVMSVTIAYALRG